CPPVSSSPRPRGRRSPWSRSGRASTAPSACPRARSRSRRARPRRAATRRDRSGPAAPYSPPDAGATRGGPRTPPRPGPSTAPALLDGGGITLGGAGVFLAAGSVLDVSGGARLGSDIRLEAGDAGKITIQTAGVDNPVNVSNFGPGLALDGELRGFSAGGKGG